MGVWHVIANTQYVIVSEQVSINHPKQQTVKQLKLQSPFLTEVFHAVQVNKKELHN